MADVSDVKIELSLPQVARYAYWGALALGAICVLVGVNGAYGWQIAGCFLGIAARVLQAEYHHRGAGRF